MKKHSMPEMKEGGVNVTPLIDIVMCLIIFFMLVAKIGVSRGVDKTIKLPKALYGTKISDLGNTLTLNIRPATKYPEVTLLVKNVKVYLAIEAANGDRPLLAALKEFKTTHKEAKIIIHADRALKYGDLEYVLVELTTAHLNDVAYETTTHDPDAAAAAAASASASP